MITEAQFQRQVVDLLHLYGWIVDFHFHSYRDNTMVGVDPGHPDITALKPPRAMVMELKMKGQLSGEQVMWLEWHMACGIEVYVIWYSETVIEDEILPILRGD